MPEDNTSDLRTGVIETGNPSPVPSFEIPPEDQHHLVAVRASAQQLAPSPCVAPDGRNLPPMTVSALPKERQPGPLEALATQSEVLAQLQGVPEEHREAAEHAAVAAAIRAVRPRLRVLTGAGPDATPLQREQLLIAREVFDHQQAIERLQTDLDEVVRHDTVIDPETGEATAVPVYQVTGDRLRAYQEMQRSHMGHIRALMNPDGTPGFEGAKRLQAAEYESVMARKALAEALEDEAAAKREAAKQEREERIAKRVASMKRLRTNAA